MRIGCIGTGNMGGALARAVAAAGTGYELFLADHAARLAETLAAELGATASDNKTIAETADYIFLGVKPQTLPELFEELRPALREKTLLISMAAGVPIARIRELSGGVCPIIRIMPNTPVSIGEGVILYTPGEGVTAEREEIFKTLLSKAGALSKIPESLMDAGCALTGCGPAFVDLFVEALADGAVACGLPRAQALEYAARTVIGAARLILETGRHPAELKDAVCSPGGATIAGVRALEGAGFRGATMEAVIAAYTKTRGLGD